MNCLEFHRLVESSPDDGDPRVAEHAGRCEACARLLARERQLTERVRVALAVDFPRDRGVVGGARAANPRPWLGWAAGIVLAIGAGLGLWLAVPNPTYALSAEVVAHVRHEPEALAPGRAEVAAAAVAATLARVGIRLRVRLGTISYVRLCDFHGASVPHLVITTAAGPLTLLILPAESITTAEPIADNELSGRIIPASRGSIAVIGHAGVVDPAAEREILNALEWL